MKRYCYLAAIFMALALTPQDSKAASDDECGIWLCAPSGFPQGCGPAKAAMLNRVKNLDPPLPPIGACLAPDSPESPMSSRHGVAAYIPAHSKCIRKVDHYNGMQCAEWQSVPEQYVRGTSCTTHHESGIREPEGCTRTARYLEIFDNGELLGSPYYW